MSHSDDSDTELNEELAQELYRTNYEVTDEDISRDISYEDLVKLCRRTKCVVELWKWNLVEDFMQAYRSAGRLEGKSKRFIAKLLMKSLRRNPELVKNSEEEKERDLEQEWRLRKKDSLLRLDVWKYDEEQKHSSANKAIDDEHSSANEDIADDDSINSTSIDVEEEQKHSSANKTIGDEHSSGNKAIDEEHLSANEDDDSIDSTSIDVENDKLGHEFSLLNSESITIGTQSMQFNTENTEYNNSMHVSQLIEIEVLPIESQSQDYDDFNHNIPISSTQDF